jgi:hypothetical protein
VIWNVLLTVFRTNCCPVVLITPGKGDVCVYEGPKNKKDRKSDVSVTESGGDGQVG